VEWVGGHAPTVYFKNAEGQTDKELALEDMDGPELLKLLESTGFTATIPQPSWSESPTSDSFGGHYYEYFSTPAAYEQSQKFARSKSHGGIQGHVVTVSSEAENNFVRDLLLRSGTAVASSWLGCSDTELQHDWSWKEGPDAGLKFWSGVGSQGAAIDSHYSNWKEHEPNNANGVEEEDCATFVAEKLQENGDVISYWNDVRCQSKNGVIVEYSSHDEL